MFRNIIVVCTGNICRSPIAECLLRDSLQDKAINVSSAGIAALVGHPADRLAREVCEEHGHDISGHRARQATQQLLAASDLILTLEQVHGDWIKANFPHLHGRTHKLGHWRSNVDVVDPYRQPKAAFEQAYQDIAPCVDDWVRKLR